MKVGVLAVQGAFAEMSAYWRAKGADAFEIPAGDTVLPAGGRAVLVMRAGSRRVPRLFSKD